MMLCRGPAMMVVADTYVHVQHLGVPQGYVPAEGPDWLFMEVAQECLKYSGLIDKMLMEVEENSPCWFRRSQWCQ